MSAYISPCAQERQNLQKKLLFRGFEVLELAQPLTTWNNLMDVGKEHLEGGFPTDIF